MTPLLAHADPNATLAYQRGEAISVRRFLGDARRLADALPETGHIINACSDRYRFAVGFAACLISGRISLLPPSHVARTLEQLRDFAADAVVLADTEQRDLKVPVMPFPRWPSTLPDSESGVCEIPSVAADQLAAWIFTSGSSGAPQSHRKHWGLLRRNVINQARALGFEPQRPFTLLGTVPPQHMYGFESTLLLAWHSGGTLVAERPFYPADIVTALAACPAPTMLITTPFHLSTILDAGLQVPSPALLLCATAPLSASLAERAEATFRAPLLEIYGSTETGQIATRRTSRETAWALFPEVRLATHNGQTWWAEGGHVEGQVPLGDIIEQVDARHFKLAGRQSDLVNIAGRRTSLGWLDRQLLSIPGVKDGRFHLPEQADGKQASEVVRLAALVVAPTLDSEQILAALRERIDAIFLPRPLVMLDDLPRNAVGKLPRAECEALLAQHARGRDTTSKRRV